MRWGPPEAPQTPPEDLPRARLRPRRYLDRREEIGEEGNRGP